MSAKVPYLVVTHQLVTYCILANAPQCSLDFCHSERKLTINRTRSLEQDRLCRAASLRVCLPCHEVRRIPYARYLRRGDLQKGG